MSEPAWRAALVSPDTVTLWEVSDTGTASAPKTLAREDLADLPGPLVIAGFDLPPHPVPAQPLQETTHTPDLVQAAAIPPLGQSQPAGLTQGAETAIAGYLADNPRFDGVLVVLMDQSCWAHISAEEVVSFQTFLTPDLMAALGASAQSLGNDFTAALTETLARPERLAQHLSSARTAGTGGEAAHLIAAELAAAKPYWLGQMVVVLGSDAAAAPYLAALRHQGVTADHSDLDTALLAGFRQAWEQIAP